MTMMTIGWDRAENAADLPRDSGVVFPEPVLTIAWRPMLNSSVLDWETRPARFELATSRSGGERSIH
jgi:hypothetical protein